MTRAEHFIRQVAERREIGHAYLFESPNPARAQKAMEEAARIIACQQGTGCGQCPSCQAFQSGNHPDIITLQKAKGAYGVQEIRSQLVGDMGIRPYRFDKKIYLIPEAETLSSLCQNTILKTLEEPPSYGVILLAAKNRHSFLPTVLSRLVCLSAEETDEASPAPGEWDGPGGRAFIRFLEDIRRATAFELLGLYKKLKEEGPEADAQLVLWEEALLQIYIAKGGGAPAGPDPALWQKFGEALSDEQLKTLWEDLGQAKARLRANMKAENVIGLLAIHLRDALLESEEI